MTMNQPFPWQGGASPSYSDWVNKAMENNQTVAGYAHERYNNLVDNVVTKIKELSELKGGEYAGDVDRLANFRRNANNLGLSMLDVWAVYAAKHWDAVMQYVTDNRNGKDRKRLEDISGRADDLIVYMILFKAIVDEMNGNVAGMARNVNLLSGRV